MAGATPPGPDERNPSTGVQRPSLFSATADDTVRIEPDTSIMAALDGRVRKPLPSRAVPLWGAVGASALLMGLAAWWWQDNSAAPAVPVVAQAASVPVARATVGSPKAASAVASAPAALAAADTAASAVAARAVIEETASGEPKPAPVLAQAASAAASTPSVASALAAVATVAVVARSQEPKVAKIAKMAGAKDGGKTGTKAATIKTAEPAASTPKMAKAEAGQPAEATPAVKDADVELLAAMMRYSDEVAAPGAGRAKAQSSAARMNELTIADLVKRCTALGGDEAAQCKKRICSGYWGKAEACPAKQAPVASKPKKQPA